MPHSARRELAYRNQNGLEVTLLWDPRSNEVSVEVVDHLDDSGFRLPIAGHLALDAFNVTNRVNYVTYTGNLSSPFFGHAVAAKPPRRLQLSVRFTFFKYLKPETRIRLLERRRAYLDGRLSDLKQSVAVAASFIYQAAMRDERLPRKALTKKN